MEILCDFKEKEKTIKEDYIVKILRIKVFLIDYIYTDKEEKMVKIYIKENIIVPFIQIVKVNKVIIVST